jgi:hypothetical protein
MLHVIKLPREWLALALLQQLHLVRLNLQRQDHSIDHNCNILKLVAPRSLVRVQGMIFRSFLEPPVVLPRS